MSSSGWYAPDRRQQAASPGPGLHVDTHVAAVNRQRERLSGRQPVAELSVHQQSPGVAEGDVSAHQVFDVDTAVTQGAAVFVRLGNLGGECDHTLEACDEILRDLVRDDSHKRILPRRSSPVATGR